MAVHAEGEFIFGVNNKLVNHFTHSSTVVQLCLILSAVEYNPTLC